MLHLFSLLPLLTPSLATLHPPFLNPGLTYDIFSPAAPQVSLLPLSDLPTIHCTPWPNWTASYREKDCYKALDIFYERNVKRHGRTLHEWVTIGDRPVGRDVPVWVPRGVVVGASSLLCHLSSLMHVQRDIALPISLLTPLLHGVLRTRPLYLSFPPGLLLTGVHWSRWRPGPDADADVWGERGQRAAPSQSQP